jgi:hypothetical protein
LFGRRLQLELGNNVHILKYSTRMLSSYAEAAFLPSLKQGASCRIFW